MNTENNGLTQDLDISQSAGVSPEARRPTGETPAGAPTITQSAHPNVQVKAAVRPAPRRKFSTAYKLKILDAYDACDNSLARGELLRKEGLYSSRISTWRKQRDEGKYSPRAKNKTPKSILHNQQLQRENEKLKKKLVQAEAIIDLQKNPSSEFNFVKNKMLLETEP